MTRPPAPGPRRATVVFSAGSGDVAGTLRAWGGRRADEQSIATAYSEQVFEAARELGIRLFVLPTGGGPARAGRVAVVPMPRPWMRGPLFPVGEFIYGLRIARVARRLGAAATVVSTGLHPAGSLAASLGAPASIHSFHNTLWPRNRGAPGGPRRWLHGVIYRLIGRRATRIICVSEEIRRQLLALAPRLEPLIVVHVPQYDAARFVPVPARVPATPFVLLFAGRLEGYKGLDDILDAARSLEQRRPGAARWLIAGDGSEAGRIAQRIVDEGLGGAVEMLGQLDRQGLIDRLVECHATLTPTRGSFAEGLAKPPLEGCLIGRPAILTDVVPAADLLDQAAVGVPAQDPGAIVRAVERLIDDPDEYRRRCEAALAVRPLMLDPARSFQAAVSRALAEALDRPWPPASDRSGS